MMDTRIVSLTLLATASLGAIVGSTSAVAGGNSVACENSPDEVDLLVCGQGPSGPNGPNGGNSSSPHAVSSIQDLACDAAADLMDFIACVKSAAPAATTELYTFPGVTESLEFGFVVEQMMSDMDDGSFDCDATIPAGLDEHYRVSTLASNGRVFCVLHEFLDADVDGYADLGWGTFLYAPDAVNEIDLQAPHVRVDLYTETEVVDLFERTRSRSALIAGSHRYANSAPSICQGHITGSDGDPYYEADAAHNIDTFYAAGKAIAAHYGVEEVDGVSDFSSVHPGFYALQFHAMGVSTCGSDHVFMSNGDGSPVLTNDGAAQLAIALQQAHSNWSVTYRGDGVTTCNRYGSHNTLSRYYNGVTDNGDNDIANPICSHDGNHPAVSARFIHIEQKRCISGTGCHYGDPDSIRTAAYWVSAVSETFDAPTCTNGIHDGDEGDVDCGGSCPLPCGPSCFDGIANGDEEGIDCGGSCPDACPTCFDGIANGDEEGIDCGGSCSTACPTCVDGIANGDEEGIHCGGSCPDACPTCVDGIANGDEEGIDCGGSCPDACPTCFDGIANGDEEGIDCGGSCPDACGGGACLLPDEGLGCTASTPCCSGTGNCSRGKPSNRVCL